MGLVDVTKEISKEKYDELCNMDYKDVDAYGQQLQDETMCPSHVYGYYGCVFGEKNGKYYLTYTRGANAD